jgi:hypothetical protein
MAREELEHIIRASSDVTDQYEFIIVGSQSILGPVPNPEEVFTMSAEADSYPLRRGAGRASPCAMQGTRLRTTEQVRVALQERGSS